MTVFISLLRGINVGGNRIIKMAALRSRYESLGLDNVKSYVQSGNVIFKTASDDDVMAVDDLVLAIHDDIL